MAEIKVDVRGQTCPVPLVETRKALRRAAPADPRQLKYARRELQSPVEKKLKCVKNLEDAHQLAHELESSETNAIFEFLITDFSVAKKSHSFLRAQLGEHIGRIMTEFPARFGGTASRLAIKALE